MNARPVPAEVETAINLYGNAVHADATLGGARTVQGRYEDSLRAAIVTALEAAEAREREACAALASRIQQTEPFDGGIQHSFKEGWASGAEWVAKSIRARAPQDEEEAK